MAYPLLPYSQLVLDLEHEVPGVYEMPFALRAKASEVDMTRLDAALRSAIRNHPVFSMRLDASGHHPSVFIDELQGLSHSMSITEEDGFILIEGTINRILGDATSIKILADDFCRAYCGLELEPDRYQDYLRTYWEHRSPERDASLEKWFDEMFGSVPYPVRPHTDVSLDDRKFQYFDIFKDTLPYDEAALHREHITPSGFVSLCAALAIMDYEGADAAALTWAYAGRDSLMEQRVFGSLHRDIPFIIRRSGSPDDLFWQARAQLRSGIAHSIYPYTLTPPHTEVWNYAVNVLQQPDLGEALAAFPFDIEMLGPEDGARQVAYSLLDIELTESDDGPLALTYKYSAAHYEPESISRFASLVRANAGWLLGGHSRATHGLEALLDNDPALKAQVIHSLTLASERCPDVRMNPVRTLEDLYAFLDRFLLSMPWESLGMGEEISTFRRMDQSTGYFLYLFDQPLPELEGRGYLYPSVQYIPAVAAWIKDFNNEWRLYLDGPDSWDAGCLAAVSSDPLFGLDRGWYESPDHWHCWNEFFSRRLSSPAARPLGPEAVAAPADGILQMPVRIGDDSVLAVPEGVTLKTAVARSVADLLGDSLYRDAFAGGMFVHQMLDFYDYHRFHCPVDGTVVDVRLIPGISGSGGVVEWDSARGLYAYANPDELGFQMIETRGVVVIDAGELGLVALVAVGMAQVCSVNWTSGIEPGREVRKGDELGYFLCGGSDVVLLSQKNVNLRLASAPGKHLLMGEGLMKY